MKKGEVTAYLSLVFILLVSLVGAVMESASIQLAKNYRRADMNRAIECIFAEYQKELLEEYDVFALEGSYETGSYAENNLLERLAFYGAGNAEQKIARIQFLTDHGCQSFLQQVNAYMEHKYGLDRVKEWMGKTDVWRQQEEKTEEIGEEGSKKQEQLADLLGENAVELPPENNPIHHMEGLQQRSLLDLVMPKGSAVSSKSIELSGTLPFRERNTGYGDFSDVEDMDSTASTLLFGEYILEHFRTAVKEDPTGTLDYEVEYILAGKESDSENLEETVKKILLMRFVPNYAFLQTDASMKAEAEALSLTLCSLLAVPAITEAAAQVILLAWAYGESIIDIRALLGGNKVPVVKSRETWQLSLSSLLTLGTDQDSQSGLDAPGGLAYKDYLRMLLFLARKEESGLRTLDMIEQNMQNELGQTYFRADYCISRMEIMTTCTLRRGITYQFPTYFGYQ